MAEPGHYPPPDFGCPAQNPTVKPQTFHHQPGQSSFHPSMWNWCETPSNPWAWDYNGHGDWHSGASTGYRDHGESYGWPAGRGNHGPKRPYHGQNFNRGGRGHQGGHQGGRQNYRPPNDNGKKRNKKEPELSHFCDPCDRGFKNQEKYDEHMSQHVKCSVADCNFTAHEKIVSFHWKNNHAPGAKRIKLDTTDEITKWREERRKNYPTLQNRENKRKVMEARVVRGDVLETAQFGRMRGRGRGRGRGNRRFRGGAPPGPQSPASYAPVQPPTLTQPPRDGDPLGALVDSEPDSDREEAAGDSTQSGLVVAPKKMTSGLGALVASYGSMSESDEEPEAIPIQRASQLVQENLTLLKTLPPRPQDSVPSGVTRPSPQGAETHQSPGLATAPQIPGRGRGRGGRRGRGRRGGRGGWQTAQKRRATLLEMLLAPDIRHERNVLLQCVRYIVRNNFFGMESKPQDQVRATATPATTGREHRRTQEMTSEEVSDSTLPTSVVNVEKGSTGSAAMPSQDISHKDPQVVQQGSSETKVLAGNVRLESRPNDAVDANATGAVVDQHMPNGNQDITETLENECDRKGLQSEQGCLEQLQVTSMALAENATPSAAKQVLLSTTEEAATKNDHDLCLTSADKVSLTPSVYDDEIWEIPGENM